MSDSRRPDTTLILAHSTAGAHAAARLVTGDAISVIDDELSEETIAQAGFEHPSQILIEVDTEDLPWLKDALKLTASIAQPDSSVKLVLRPDATPSALEGAVGDVFDGWAVSGAAVEGDVTALTITPVSEAIDETTTIDSIRGAFLIAEVLRTVVDPASHDLEEFEYRSSLMLSYLTAIPSLHREIDGLNSDLRKMRAVERELRTEVEGLKAGGTPSTRADSTVPTVTSKGTSPSRRRGRARKLAIVIGAGLVWIALAAAATSLWDLDSTGFLVLLVLGGVAAAILDNRRRSVTLLGAARKGAAATRSVGGIAPTLEQHRQQTERAIGQAVVRQAEATRQHTSQVGTQLAGAVASSGNDVTTQVIDAVSKAFDTGTRTTTEQVAATKAEILKAVPRAGDLRAMVRTELLNSYHQIEANMRLRDVVQVTGPTPQLRGWAASPDVLVLLVREMQQLDPEIFLECGSGASTVWLAMACKSARLRTRLVALEHDPVYGAETSRLLAECGVDDIAEVRSAPLEETTIDGQQWTWYATSALEGLERIGLVFVDGPPATTGKNARYPALPVLRPRLAPTATIVLDDTVREDEREIVDSWLTEFPEMKVDTHRFEKGAAVFRLGVDDTGVG